MHELFGDLERWHEAGEEIALATLVRVHGSAPRGAGARLAITRSGKMTGSVTGGCVESDVVERARLVLDLGAPVVATYGVGDELGLEVGLSCAGSIEVLIERFEASAAWRALGRALATHAPAALAVGLAPDAVLGRHVAILADGTTVGTIAAAVDGPVAKAAREHLAEGGTRVLAVPTPRGEHAVFVEAFPPPPRLVIVGATETARVLVRLAKPLGFHATVIDARGAYLTRERFPEADALASESPAAVLDTLGLDASAYVVVLTHDVKFDLPALARALRSDARYVGAMGSRGTHERRKAALRREGFSEAELARIHAPIGLDLGGRGPAEIAVAILAEILAVRHGRDGAPLARKHGRIHGETP